MKQIELFRSLASVMIRMYVTAFVICIAFAAATYIYSSIYYFHNGIPFYRIYRQPDKTKEQKRKEIIMRIATLCLLIMTFNPMLKWLFRIICFAGFLIVHGKLNRSWTNNPEQKSKRIKYYFFPFTYYLYH